MCRQAICQCRKKKGHLFKYKNYQPYDPPLQKDEKEECKVYLPPFKVEEINKEGIKLKNDGIKHTIDVVQPLNSYPSGVMVTMDVSSRGTKREHETECSDQNKEQAPSMNNAYMVVDL